MKTAIENIIVKERIRKEILKISELAEDIRQNGLLNPITVMMLDGGKYQLLAGLRRLKAIELIGLTEIEVNVVFPSDAEAALNIEISENEQREDFTYSEKMDYARMLEAIEREKAKIRKLAGVKLTDTDLTPQGAEGSIGETRQIVASKIGMGKTTYDRAKYIAENAPEDVIEQLDKGERSIRGTYDELRAQDKTSIPRRSCDVLSKHDIEAERKLKEFNALSPEDKVTELEQQLFDIRVRAVAAESDLAELQLRYDISTDHKESIIESLKRQNAELSDALKAANTRLAELEAIHMVVA